MGSWDIVHLSPLYIKATIYMKATGLPLFPCMNNDLECKFTYAGVRTSFTPGISLPLLLEGIAESAGKP